jgi:hypothetical protein
MSARGPDHSASQEHTRAEPLDGFVGMEKWGSYVAHFIDEGLDEDAAWQAAVDAVNAREVGNTQEQNEQHVVDLAADGNSAARAMANADKTSRMYAKMDKLDGIHAKMDRVAQVQAKVDRVARMLAYHEACLNLSRLSSQTQRIDAMLSRRLATRIVTVCVARPREAHRPARRVAAASSSKSDTSDPEPPPAPSHEGLERLGDILGRLFDDLEVAQPQHADHWRDLGTRAGAR